MCYFKHTFHFKTSDMANNITATHILQHTTSMLHLISQACYLYLFHYSVNNNITQFATNTFTKISN